MGKKFANRGNTDIWGGLIAGCLLIGGSMYNLLIREDAYISWRGGYVPIWVNWIMLPLGIGITAVSIYALITGKGKKPTYTDEELAQAKAEMDAMYLREHGELPNKQKPEPEKPTPEKPKEDTKPIVQEDVKKASAQYKW